MKGVEETIEAIARERLNIPTIEVRGTEAQDVYRLHIDQIRRALLAAYMTGVEDAAEAEAID